MCLALGHGQLVAAVVLDRIGMPLDPYEPHIVAPVYAQETHPQVGILLAGEPDELDRYQKILADRYDGLLDVYKSAPYFLEIMPFGVTKGSMLPLLLDKLKMKRDELVAFGDNYNDMTMIGYAGFGVAMGNAEPDIKKIADYICESNDEDGIANTLEKYILKS